MKKLITLVCCLLFVLGLAGCGSKEAQVWEWAQGLSQEDLVRVTPRSQEHDTLPPLNEEYIPELVALLNDLSKDNFTENKKLAGSTPTFGITIETASEIYHINEAIGPYGALEITYHEKLWWIDYAELSDFVQRVALLDPAE